MTAYLVRHAEAGDRELWDKPDHLRPLTEPGLQQAQALVDQLAAEPVDRIVSSPYVRCVQSVEPLAEARRIEVELSDALAEGAGPEDALELVKKSKSSSVVLCSHGDVIQELLERLTEDGLVDEDDMRLPKGSTWAIETRDDGEIVAARYLPPPA